MLALNATQIHHLQRLIYIYQPVQVDLRLLGVIIADSEAEVASSKRSGLTIKLTQIRYVVVY